METRHEDRRDRSATGTGSLPISSHTPAPYDGPSRDEVLAMRRQYLTPGLITYYREPLLIAEGHMQYVWDETGKQYLDAFAGIVTVSVGHCHPRIVEKVREQVGRLQHTTTIYLHPAIAPARQEAGRAHARGERPVGQLLHEFRQRGQRDRHPVVARVHRQHRRHQPAQRLPRRDAGGHGADRARDLEVQVEPDGRREARDAGLLLSLPVTAWSIRAAT